MPVTINGSNTPTAGGVTYGDGTQYATTAAGTSGQVLTSAGASAPTWSTPSSGASVFISSVTASNSATAAFTSGIDSTYEVYMITFSSVIPATDNVELYTRTSSNGGSTWTSTANYKYGVNSYSSGGSSSFGTATSVTAIRMSNTLTNTAMMGGLCGFFYIFSPTVTSTYKQYLWQTSLVDGSVVPYTMNGAGVTSITSSINAIQFYMTSGNIASGTFRLYGIKNS